MSWRAARRILTVGLGTVPLFAGLALAQAAHDTTTLVATKNDATALAKDASALQFESVLSRYKPMTDQKLGSWRDANDTVTRIGGWRNYLKEAQAPDASVSTTPDMKARSATPSAPAAPNPHAGHGVKP